MSNENENSETNGIIDGDKFDITENLFDGDEENELNTDDLGLEDGDEDSPSDDWDLDDNGDDDAETKELGEEDESGGAKKGKWIVLQKKTKKKFVLKGYFNTDKEAEKKVIDLKREFPKGRFSYGPTEKALSTLKKNKGAIVKEHLIWDDEIELEIAETKTPESKAKMLQAMNDKMGKMDQKKLNSCYTKVMSSMNFNKEENDLDDALELEETIKKSKPKGKASMIQSMMDTARGMDKTKLAASYKKIMSSMDIDGDGKDEEDSEETKKSPKSKTEMKKMTKEDIDVSDDISALFDDGDFSEEFKTKATNIFEAAVVAKVNEQIENARDNYDDDLKSEKEEIIEAMESKLSKYLDYVVEKWMEENKLAVEQGVRAEIAENCLRGFKNVMAENYIDIPEEKVDLADEMASKLERLETSLNEEMEKNIGLRRELDEQNKEAVLLNNVEGLSMPQIDKMRSLAEGIDFEGKEQYEEQLSFIKERFFTEESKYAFGESFAINEEEEFIGDDDEGENTPSDPAMRIYTASISKLTTKD